MFRPITGHHQISPQKLCCKCICTIFAIAYWCWDLITYVFVRFRYSTVREVFILSGAVVSHRWWAAAWWGVV